ncbi:MAG: ATP-binding protein involved in chromosome partitioning [Methylobacteriaceae bacterium]|nr:ATP-binding protein involved in chromosome partitioning [Methylobacteriaceae bacterium]
MASESDVLKALEAVNGPDGKTPLPRSGAITGLSIRGDKAYLAIAIDPKRSMELEPMRAAAEDAAKRVRGISSAIVTLTSERPQGAAPQPPPPPGPRAQAAQARRDIPGIRRIIAVASGKGGVGKSTLAANLALGLSAEGWRVGLLDADIYGPSVPRLFGINRKPEVEGRILKPIAVHGLAIMSIGFLVEEATAMVWRGPMVMSALTQLLREVAWGERDCLVVDMPPGTGDAQLTLAQNVPLAGAVIVSTPQDLALIDARRGIAMFQQTHVPILGVVENMSYFLCPHCGARTDVFAHGGARHEAERLGVPFLGEVPLDVTIRASSDGGRPIVASEPDSPQAQAFRAIARKVKASLEGAPARAAPRIVVE